MTTLLVVIATALSALVLIHGLWWLVLAAAALPRPRPAAALTRGHLSIAVIVPAYNEETMLGRTLASLAAAPWQPRPEVLVVADNCSDATAAVARGAGVTVVERVDPANRGKSHALEFALDHLRQRPSPPDVVAVVDADTTVSSTFYGAIAARIAGGADAVQVHYAVAPAAAPLAQLRSLAFALVHWSRPLGASRLGLGMGLKGNGMAFRWEVIRDGFGGAGITEDAAATLALARRGIAVRFAPGATVWGHMAGDYHSASVQDRRWEGGRFALAGPALATAAGAARRGRFAAAAGALEVASLPLTLLVAAGAVAVLLTAVAGGLLVFPSVALAVLAASVVVGWVAARVPLASLGSLVHVPRFVVHKLLVLAAVALRRGPSDWHRTNRTGAS